jgi:hypothetical protein
MVMTPGVFAPITMWYNAPIDRVVETVWAGYRDDLTFEERYWRLATLSAVIVHAPRRVVASCGSSPRAWTSRGLDAARDAEEDGESDCLRPVQLGGFTRQRDGGPHLRRDVVLREDEGPLCFDGPASGLAVGAQQADDGCRGFVGVAHDTGRDREDVGHESPEVASGGSAGKPYA